MKLAIFKELKNRCPTPEAAFLGQKRQRPAVAGTDAPLPRPFPRKKISGAGNARAKANGGQEQAAAPARQLLGLDYFKY